MAASPHTAGEAGHLAEHDQLMQLLGNNDPSKTFVPSDSNPASGVSVTGSGLVVVQGTTTVQAALADLDGAVATSALGTGIARPTGAIAETFPRLSSMGTGAVTSGVLHGSLIGLAKGKPISSISLFSMSTPVLAGATNQWFGLLDLNGALLAVTSDDGSAAWAASTRKTLPLTSAYVPTYTGAYYIARMIAAATTPNIVCLSAGVSVAATAENPVFCYNAGSGLTTPPAIGTVFAPDAGSSTAVDYGYVS